MPRIAGEVSDPTPQVTDVHPLLPHFVEPVPGFPFPPYGSGFSETGSFFGSSLSQIPPRPRPAALEFSPDSPPLLVGAAGGGSLSTGATGSSISLRRIRSPTLSVLTIPSPTSVVEQKIQKELPGLRKIPPCTTLVCDDFELGKGGNSRVLRGHYVAPHPYAYYSDVAIKMTSMTEAKLPQFAMLRRVYARLRSCRCILKPIDLYYVATGDRVVLGNFVEVLPVMYPYVFPSSLIVFQAHLQRIVNAVRHIHELGVAHLDLKFDNILVDSWGLPFISDFGESKFYREEGVRDLAVGTTTSLIVNAKSMPLFFEQYDECLSGCSESLRTRLPLVIVSFTAPDFLPYIDLLMLGIMFDEVFVKHAENSSFPPFFVSKIRNIGRLLIYSALRQLLAHWQSTSGVLEGVRLNLAGLPGFRAHRPIVSYNLTDCLADLKSL